MKKKWMSVAAMFALAGLAGCSGGGGGSGGTASSGAVTGLEVADKVSVVDASASSSGASKIVGLALAGAVPSDSDYTRDKTFSYVHDRSTEAFKMVNEILCMIGQTKYADMVNMGTYKAQINTKTCKGNDSSDNASASQQGGSSASDAPEYETWIVESTRPDNNAAQTVKVWFHQKSEGGNDKAKFMNAKMVITEAASNSNPYGIFTMNFAAYQEGTSTVLFKGLMKSEKDAATGKVLLKFVEEETSGKFKQSASLEKNANGTGGGTAYQYENFNGAQEGTINFAYNTNLFHRIDDGGGNEACLDRADFETSAWRYGMYDATTGSRVNVSSGFPINTASDGKGSNGWVGFWGLWVPDGVTINNDATVYKQTYGPNGGTSLPYTVQKVAGKLKKHTKSELELRDIKNIPMEGGIPDPSNPGANNNMYRVTWDGTDLAIRAEAQMSNNAPPEWSNLYQPITNTTHLSFGELSFFSQALGGQVRIMLQGCAFTPPSGQAQGYTTCNTATAATKVVFYKEDIVYPGDTVPALVCYDNCPSITSGVVSGNSGQNAQTFTFANMVLKDFNGAALVQTAEGGQSWGFNSGPLFDVAKNTAADLACPWDSQQICGWRAWSALNQFYTWETGLNNWNQLTLLKDGNGTPLIFEQPLRVEYTHTQTVSTKPDYKYNGVKFFLDYNGFGELQGIPGKCVDLSGEAATCNQNTRWVPEFSIPAGASASYVKNSTTYSTIIKPLEVEQRMVKLDDPAACSALPTTAYTLPLISEWADPANGAEPTVTAAPAVIGGVVQ